MGKRRTEGAHVHTDKGPRGAWLYQIGRPPDPFCGCGETQNAAHLLASGYGGARNGNESKFGQVRSSVRRWLFFCCRNKIVESRGAQETGESEGRSYKSRIYRGWRGPEVGQISWVPTRGCVP